MKKKNSSPPIPLHDLAKALNILTHQPLYKTIKE